MAEMAVYFYGNKINMSRQNQSYDKYYDVDKFRVIG
jgi:hypothetical protein